MIWHHSELMEFVFALISVTEKNVDKQFTQPVGLQNVSLLKSGSSKEIAAVTGDAVGWRSHKAPQRLKPLSELQLIAALKALRHPEGGLFFSCSQIGMPLRISAGRYERPGRGSVYVSWKISRRPVRKVKVGQHEKRGIGHPCSGTAFRQLGAGLHCMR